MKLYELIVIFNPTLDETAATAEVDKIERQITAASGTIEKIERWGMRRMTYRISGHHQGNYVFFLFKANPGLTTEIERNLRLNENVLRFLTVLSPGLAPAKPIKVVVEEDESQFDEYTP